MTCVPIPCFFVRAIAYAALSQGFYFGGKRIGCGSPGGLPLICRFSYITPALSFQERGRVVGSTSRWRTLILVILSPLNVLRSQDHALFFPGYRLSHACSTGVTKLFGKWKGYYQVSSLDMHVRHAGGTL